MVSKVNTYLACQKGLEHWKGLQGKENQDYLKANFDTAWNELAVNGKKAIDVTEAYNLVKTI